MVTRDSAGHTWHTWLSTNAALKLEAKHHHDLGTVSQLAMLLVGLHTLLVLPTHSQSPAQCTAYSVTDGN